MSNSAPRDAGKRRYLSWSHDFDTRAILLKNEIDANWEEEVKERHRTNQESIRASLALEYGAAAIDQKIINFIDLDTKPFSIISYHNALFHQVRQSFVIGGYYPALVGACTLAERILNHLIIDLRAHYRSTPEYPRVYRKDSFDDWRVPIEVLASWGVLLPEAVKEFRLLMPLRHRSVHFNPETYVKLREDCLSAILHVRSIIETQFGSFALRPWFIAGTLGHVFIKKEWENHPLIQTYFLPNCPFVGPLFAMKHGPDGWSWHDYEDYGPGDWSDDEFASEYNNRDPGKVVNPD